jgi:hypothetical protein
VYEKGSILAALKGNNSYGNEKKTNSFGNKSENMQMV